MSRIDDLIAELAPNGVEHRSLGEVIDLKFGSRITKMSDSGTLYPVYGGGGESFRTDRFNREEDFVVSRFAMSAQCVRKVRGQFWLLDSGFTFEVLTPDVMKDFVAQWLYAHQTDIYRCSSEGAQKNLKVNEFRRFRIPVPPLPVQQEIVRILDEFSQLEAELEAELESRRRQYDYYRSALLAPREGIRLVPLGEIASFKYGYTAKAALVGSHRFLRITDINQQGKLSPNDAKYVEVDVTAGEYVVQRGDLLMARTGATFGKTVLIGDGDPAVYASFLIRIRLEGSELLPEYYWHFAQSSAYWDQANALVSTGGQPQFNANVLKQVRVPVPPLSEQQEVIDALNRFDALTNDLTIGLPAELAARRKQYEYYRDKLLTFKEFNR